ncbi:MAG: hypothetical protein R3C26_05960 [Calditrichia bacterium]
MSFASLAEQKKIHLQFSADAPPKALANSYFDREKMETIVTNLLSNAFKFTPARRIGEPFPSGRRTEKPRLSW